MSVRVWRFKSSPGHSQLRYEVIYEKKFRDAPNALVCVGLSSLCDRV